jgi:hypothetical protein
MLLRVEIKRQGRQGFLGDALGIASFSGNGTCFLQNQLEGVCIDPKGGASTLEKQGKGMVYILGHQQIWLGPLAEAS